MKTTLTEQLASAAAIPAGKSEVMLWDAKQAGLALRLRGNARTWIVAYRPEGGGRRVAMQKITLGSWPAVSVAAARKAARERMGQIAAGRDPAAELREAKRKELATVEKALTDYEASLAARGIVKIKDSMSTLRRGLARYEKRDVAELTLRDVLAPIETLEALGKPGAALDLRKNVRAFLAWAQMSGRVHANVLAGVRRQRATRTERLVKACRGRALTDPELAALWRAATPDTVVGRYIRALILTGCRRGEMSGLTWDMVGSDRITLPPTHTKQGRAHVVPITAALREVLEACPRTSSSVVFASPRSNGVMRGWSQIVAKVEKASGVAFDLHDLRRTLRSGLSRLGVPTELAETCIGHQRAELIKIYDRDDKWPERVAAFTRWSEHVARVAAGDTGPTVVEFAARRAAS
ncbi:MAG: DUF4102 domain-containing protein [Azospirillum sp.]|nr:DUF4102 domain-containing protein [Azospirillum sp.]